MADVINIHVWNEGGYRSSVQGDVPATFAFPEPFWSEYSKRKEIPPNYLAGFGEAIFRSAFNSLARDDLARKVLAELKQDPLTISIISSEEKIHEIPWELMKLPGKGFLGAMGNIAFVRTLPGRQASERRSSPPYRTYPGRPFSPCGYLREGPS